MELTEVETNALKALESMHGPAHSEDVGKALGYSAAGALYILRKLEKQGVAFSRKNGRALEWEASSPLHKAAHHADQQAQVTNYAKGNDSRHEMLEQYVQAANERGALLLRHRQELADLDYKLLNLRHQLFVEVPEPEQPAKKPKRLHERPAKAAPHSMVQDVIAMITRDGALGIQELADRCGLEKTQVRGVIAQLIKRGKASRRADDGRYELLEEASANGPAAA